MQVFERNGLLEYIEIHESMASAFQAAKAADGGSSTDPVIVPAELAVPGDLVDVHVEQSIVEDGSRPESLDGSRWSPPAYGEAQGIRASFV